MEDSRENYICLQRNRSKGNNAGFEEREKRTQYTRTVSYAKERSHGARAEKRFCVSSRHSVWHESLKPETELSVGDIEFIQEKVSERLAPFQICNVFRTETCKSLSWSKVYY